MLGAYQCSRTRRTQAQAACACTLSMCTLRRLEKYSAWKWLFRAMSACAAIAVGVFTTRDLDFYGIIAAEIAGQLRFPLLGKKARKRRNLAARLANSECRWHRIGPVFEGNKSESLSFACTGKKAGRVLRCSISCVLHLTNLSSIADTALSSQHKHATAPTGLRCEDRAYLTFSAYGRTNNNIIQLVGMIELCARLHATLVLPEFVLDIARHMDLSELKQTHCIVSSAKDPRDQGGVRGVVVVRGVVAYDLGRFVQFGRHGAVGYRASDALLVDLPIDAKKLALYRLLFHRPSSELSQALRERMAWLCGDFACNYSAVHLRVLEHSCDAVIDEICHRGYVDAAGCVRTWRPRCHVPSSHVHTQLRGCARPVALVHDGMSARDVARLTGWLHSFKEVRNNFPNGNRHERSASVFAVLLDLLTLAHAQCAVFNPASSFTFNARYLSLIGQG